MNTMEIVLMCAHEKGSVAFSAEIIEGLPAPQRRYAIINHRVVLSGHADVILHDDAAHLLRNPLYRMPTPAEQDQITKAEQGKHEIQESEQGEELETFIPLGPDVMVVSPVMAARLARIEGVIPIASDDSAPDAPPAQQKRPYKKRG